MANIDLLTFKILTRIHTYSYLDKTNVPKSLLISSKEYKNNPEVLEMIVGNITTNDYLENFSIVSYSNSGLEINIRELSLTEEGITFIEQKPSYIRAKHLFNKAIEKYNTFKDDLDNNYEKYQDCSDERLIRIIKSNSYPSTAAKFAILKIAKERGLILQKDK